MHDKILQVLAKLGFIAESPSNIGPNQAHGPPHFVGTGPASGILPLKKKIRVTDIWTTPVRKDSREARKNPRLPTSFPQRRSARPSVPSSRHTPPFPSQSCPQTSPLSSGEARSGGEDERAVRMLWVDKYRPKTLDKVTVHDQVAQNLRKLVSAGDLRVFS